VLSWPLKMRAGKGSFFFGRLKEALKKISAGRHPVLAELHESFLGQAGGALELAAGKHYQCDTANAEVRKDGRPASPRVAEQAKEVLRTFNRVEGPLLYPRVLDTVHPARRSTSLRDYEWQMSVYAQLYRVKAGHYPRRAVLYFLNELKPRAGQSPVTVRPLPGDARRCRSGWHSHTCPTGS
jgi:hypothetical protein